ncbi:MAG TPA: hypothetical protein VMS64_05090 [Candidatus Methylomirabilis sp.]|nr:hypothetical protein [Candidatus Methylomirabilis sp.]
MRETLLDEFKQVLREQFFALLLDPEGALAAIPKMLPADAGARGKALAASGPSCRRPAK